MSENSGGLLALGLVTLATWAVPALGVRMLVPSLSMSEHRRANYRGRMVFLGLGTVWVFWTLGIMALGAALPFLPPVLGDHVPGLLGAVAWLATMCFAFGLIDDVFGTSAEKGLRGHLRALSRGRLTTGGLKLVGIGFASLVVAANTGIRGQLSDWNASATAAAVVLTTVVIAGSSNLLNLLDLRPGRALKGYLALAIVAWGLWLGAGWRLEGGWAPGSAFAAASLAVALVGPALAVWRFDIGERGMLGDAGANPAGAVAGLVLAAALPIWGLAVAAAVVVAANLASERVSFSAVIERNKALSWLDSLGRAPGGAGEDAPRPGSSHGGGPGGASDR